MSSSSIYAKIHEVEKEKKRQRRLMKEAAQQPAPAVEVVEEVPVTVKMKPAPEKKAPAKKAAAKKKK